MIWIKQGVTGDWINCLIHNLRIAPVAFSFIMEILQLEYSIQPTIKRTRHLYANLSSRSWTGHPDG